MVIGHAYVRDDGSINVHLDLSRGFNTLLIHSAEEPVANGHPHVFFTDVEQVLKFIHLANECFARGDTGFAWLQAAITRLEAMPGYQDWLDDQDADDAESKPTR